MRRPLLPWIALGLAAALVAACALSLRRTPALTVAVVAADVPLVASVAAAVTPQRPVDEGFVAGVPVSIARPRGPGPWPALVFVNGATPRGRLHPGMRVLAATLADAGYLVVVPEPPGAASGAVTIAGRDAVAAVAAAVADRHEALGGRVALGGVSSGGGLALLAAARPAVADRVDVVVAVAPYARVADVIRTATTGAWSDFGAAPYPTRPFLRLALARSLVAALPPGADRTLLASRLRHVPRDTPDPLAALRRVDRLDRDSRAVVSLLSNTRPARFGPLYAQLSPRVRATNDALSPLAVARHVRARVYISYSSRDPYFAPDQVAALAAALRRSVVAEGLGHGVSRRPLRAAVDALAFTRLVRTALADVRATASRAEARTQRRARPLRSSPASPAVP